MTLLLGSADLTGLVSRAEVIAAVRTALVDLAEGRAEQPAPTAFPGTGTTQFLPMTATSHRLGLSAVKVMSDAPDNRAAGLPTQRSTVLLLDARTGECLAVLDGEVGTRTRTAAASAVATDALARPDTRVLGLVGAGRLAIEHVHALREVRALDTVHVWSRSAATLCAFHDAVGDVVEVVEAPGPRHVVEAADIVCTLTPARLPVVHGEWFRPGQHINAVGAPPRPDHREIDAAGMARATVVVDSTPTQLLKSGEAVLSIAEGATTTDTFTRELGAVLAGLTPGRRDPQEVTLFNSVGIALQDLAYTALAVDRARTGGVGINTRTVYGTSGLRLTAGAGVEAGAGRHDDRDRRALAAPAGSTGP
ncbi:ornithine cyclodeaminase family protein [Streptomyces sp. NPDC087305]|uniref:ornithine cyclodeaminase family protein n=1 Tax=Streptomyces sp. NPDC087305 TaxID=3365781 RepID=UPI00382107E4